MYEDKPDAEFENVIDNSEPNKAEEDTIAEGTALEVFGNEENAEKTGQLIASFLASYGQRDSEQSLEEWLIAEFWKYPAIWKDEAEIIATAREIIQSIQEANANKVALYTHLDTGKSKASWLAAKIESGAKAAGVTQIGAYAAQIDKALNKATNDMLNKAVLTKNKIISIAYNLDGFIAEQHHADTFNIEAASRGSEYRAEVPKSNKLNSPDIVIRDAKGKVVRSYQSKYGKDAETTKMLLEKGDYQGQDKVVPAEQAGQIEGASDVIEFDGIKSKPLPKAEAKEIQRKAQEEAEARQYEWNDVNKINIAKQIGKQALIGACIAVGLQGARILGRRVWSKIKGKENPPVNEDLREFFQSSLKSASHVGVQVVVSGAVVVAIKNGLIKTLQTTPAGQIANMVYLGLENAKVLYKLAKGEINAAEAMDEMGNVTLCAGGGLIGAGLGALMVAGPISGFIGAVAGGMAGAAIGEGIYNGAKKFARITVEYLGEAWESAKETAKEKIRGPCEAAFAPEE